MCLIVFKPAGIPWDNTAITHAFDNNPDGAGLMFPKGGKVQIERAFWTTDMLFEYLGENDLTDRDVVLHFRWATHGKVDITNCHPYPIQAKPSTLHSLTTPLGMAHNGVIPGMDVGGDYSDTLQFITQSLIHLRPHIGQAWFSPFLASATNSKFAFMAADGAVTLVGEFVEDKGAWYSNTSFEPYIPREWVAGEDWEKVEDWDNEECVICEQASRTVLGGVCADCERVYANTL